MVPAPFFVEYGAYAANHGGVLRPVPSKEDFALDVDAIAAALPELRGAQDAAMVGYRLKNTVSPFGTVTRGVCHVTDGKLDRVVETFKLTVFPDGTIRDVDKNPEGDVYAPDTPVSMNFWGFTPWIFTKLEEYFNAFLQIGRAHV